LSTIITKSTKRQTIPHLKYLHTIRTTSFSDGNSGSVLRQTHICGGVNPVNRYL